MNHLISMIKHNGYLDESKILALISVATFIGLSIFDCIVKSHPFSPQSFGMGLGSLLAGVSAWTGTKGYRENNNIVEINNVNGLVKQ